MVHQGRRIRCLSSCMEELHSVSLPALVSRICSFSRPSGCRIWISYDILMLLVSFCWDEVSEIFRSQFQTCRGPSLSRFQVPKVESGYTTVPSDYATLCHAPDPLGGCVFAACGGWCYVAGHFQGRVGRCWQAQNLCGCPDINRLMIWW